MLQKCAIFPAKQLAISKQVTPLLVREKSSFEGKTCGSKCRNLFLRLLTSVAIADYRGIEVTASVRECRTSQEKSNGAI